MTCADMHGLLLDAQRGRLAPNVLAEMGAHVQTCAACLHEEAAEQLLTETLESRLPQHAAPLALKRRLAAQWPGVVAPEPSAWQRWSRSLLPALAVAAALLVVVPLYYQRTSERGSILVAEAVNNHLRILSSQHPLDIENGGMHQVKPWFEGRLDFAPVVRFLGDQDVALQGGAVGYYLDRKAAVFVFHRRLHAVSLFVFRADGLPWPTRGLQRIGRVQAQVSAARGFNIVLWREQDLGYVLVSDMDMPEVTHLAEKLAPTAGTATYSTSR